MSYAGEPTRYPAGQAMILEAVINTLRRHVAFADGELAVVAVSGGSDSVALLHLLMRLRETLGIDLHVASLNHGLRAEAGRRDLEFVADLAARWRLPYTIDHADVAGHSAEWGIGLEQAARRARYAFLARVAREQGGACVAVGHHALDQAETIVMNIARGSGIHGLSGMRVVSRMPGQGDIRLLRPLLGVSKDDLASYCRQHKLPFRLDETNADISYKRNFVRHEIVSRLTRLNPDLLRAIERLTESASVDEAFIAACFDRAVMPLLRISPGRWQIGQADFANLHSALQRRFMMKAYKMVAPEPAALAHDLVLDLVAWSQAARTGDRRDMSGAVRICMRYDGISIERKDAVMRFESYRLIPAALDKQLRLDSPFLDYGLAIRLSPAADERAEGLSLRLPAELELRLRTRRPGDRFAPKGMGGHSRKVKRWMIDRKIPREIRDHIPLVCAAGDVIAICLGEVWHLADAARFHQRAPDFVLLSLA